MWWFLGCCLVVRCGTCRSVVCCGIPSCCLVACGDIRFVCDGIQGCFLVVSCGNQVFFWLYVTGDTWSKVVFFWLYVVMSGLYITYNPGTRWWRTEDSNNMCGRGLYVVVFRL